MGIRFKIHETPRPKGRKGPKLIHARALCDSTVKMDHLCKMICSRSTISSADVKAVLDSFVWAIGFSLESGQHVELEELRNAELKLFTEKNVVFKIGGGTHVMYVLPADNEETK